MEFPYGRAPLAILIMALVSGGVLLGMSLSAKQADRPDLILATFTKEHAESYRLAVPEFEKKHKVKIQIQHVDQRALRERLQSALLAGAEVPDMVELLDGTMGVFSKGPIEQVGFVDLTQRVHETGLWDSLVQSRYSKWSSRGHIFALPHDVHPMALAYRRDVVEELGIDVKKLTTWEEFARVGREVTKDLDGDGVPDRYMIDFPPSDAWGVRALLLQRGGRLFKDGRCSFDSDEAADVVTWYVQQLEGPNRISFPAGWGQTLARSIIDGLCLFYICPDWRTDQIQTDVPSVAGKMALMPLPAWEEGAIRTSTWGGTGLAFTKQVAERGKMELAWELAMFLYYDPQKLGPSFVESNILPPLKEAWTQPEFSERREYWSDMKLGEFFASLAPDTPAEESNAYMTIAEGKLISAYTETLRYYTQELLPRKLDQETLEKELRAYAVEQLKIEADKVRRIMDRNVFLKEPAASDAGGEAE